MGLATIGLGWAGLEAAGAGRVCVLMVVMVVVPIVMVMGGRRRGDGSGSTAGCGRADRTRGHTRTLAVPEIMRQYSAWHMSHVGCRYAPVIAMRLATDRLGRRWRESHGLTQRGGNEAQEGGTICNGLHLGSGNAMLSRVVRIGKGAGRENGKGMSGSSELGGRALYGGSTVTSP
jgi:hypothetical protein